MSSKVKLSAATGGRSALVPNLRFPEFREAAAWAPVSLRRATVPVDERVGKRMLTPVSISAGIGFVPQAEKFGRDISGNQYQLYTLVRDGDFVFNKGNSLKFPQGCIYLLQGWGQVAAPNVFIAFRLKEGYSNGFFQNCFEQNQHGKQLKKHITSGARSNGLLNISKDTFFGIEIALPSFSEQQKIADCLASADALIVAQERKVEALRAHKKGLMQQLFPQEGETQPRLRFPEFQDEREWVPQPVGAVCTSFSGGTPSTSHLEFYGGNIPFIRSAEINSETTELFLSREGLENSAAKMVEKGDVLFALYGANSGDVAIARIAGAINQAILCLRPTVNAKFLSQILACRKDWIIAKYLQGGQGNLSGEIVKSIKLSFPLPREQQRIADCLTSLDDLIAAESQKLDTLKTHKKGLMQQLFPKVGEADT